VSPPSGGCAPPSAGSVGARRNDNAATVAANATDPATWTGQPNAPVPELGWLSGATATPTPAATIAPAASQGRIAGQRRAGTASTGTTTATGPATANTASVASATAAHRPGVTCRRSGTRRGSPKTG
jgi:hypothetical protein